VGKQTLRACSSAPAADEWIRLALAADRSRRPMARQHHNVVAERKQLGLNATEEQLAVTAGQIPTADAASEQDIAADQQWFVLQTKAQAVR
jgi:hypothetical protein